MVLVLIGVLLLALKLLGVGGEALPWWLVAACFVGAAGWWAYADSSGLTQKRSMDKAEDRKRLRRERALESLGMKGTPPGKR
jgi:small Trp-rich protein